MRLCDRSGCFRPHKARGVCDFHYARLDWVKKRRRDKARAWYNTPAGQRKSRRYRASVRGKANQLRNKYGLTFMEFLEMLKRQKRRCAICRVRLTGKTRNTRPHVDHNHRTKKVRGILCNTCNRGIGLLKDSVRVLKTAVTYLEGR